MARSVESLPLSTRAVVVPHGLIDAMKSGHMILIQGSRLQSPYNQISRAGIEVSGSQFLANFGRT